MIRINEQEELFTRYLLGDLTEQERARLEEEYFTDDDAFERLLVVKGELLDAYARGDLSGRERELFEQHFLSTRPRRQRLSEATELIEFSTAAAAETTVAVRERGAAKWWPLLPTLSHRPAPALGFALATILAVAALGGLWAFFKFAEPRRAERAINPPPAPEIASGRQTESAPLPNDDDAGATASARTPPVVPPHAKRATARDAPAQMRPAAKRVVSVLLTPVLTRGDAGQANTLIIRPGTSAARLRLAFRGGDYRSYVAALQTVEGERVWSGTARKVETNGAGEIVVVNVPAGVLRRKDYIITLSGVIAGGETKEINEYFLTIRKD